MYDSAVGKMILRVLFWSVSIASDRLSKFSLVIAIERWKSEKQARYVRERCIDSFKHICLRAILHVLFRAPNSLFKNIRK